MTQYATGAWTRVGERLPEYGVQVLAWTGDGGYPVIAYLRRDEHGDFWEGFHNGEEVDIACVTLWTPMPSPPHFEQNTQDQQPRTKEAATMSDTNERSVASAGSVACKPVAWIAVFDGDDADGEFVWPDKGRAIEWASTRPGVRIAPLYLQPQSAVVRLPPLDPNGAPGWNAAIGAVREALAEAGVDWDTE